MKNIKYHIMTVAGVLSAGLGFYLIKALPTSTVPYLCIGIGCGIFGYGAGELLKKSAVRKNPELAKQIDIEVKDERNVMHANASKAKGFDMMTYVFGALLMIYVFMNAPLKIVLPFIGAYLFVQFVALYHRLKLDKEQ